MGAHCEPHRNSHRAQSLRSVTKLMLVTGSSLQSKPNKSVSAGRLCSNFIPCDTPSPETSQWCVSRQAEAKRTESPRTWRVGGRTLQRGSFSFFLFFLFLFCPPKDEEDAARSVTIHHRNGDKQLRGDLGHLNPLQLLHQLPLRCKGLPQEEERGHNTDGLAQRWCAQDRLHGTQERRTLHLQLRCWFLKTRTHPCADRHLCPQAGARHVSRPSRRCDGRLGSLPCGLLILVLHADRHTDGSFEV